MKHPLFSQPINPAREAVIGRTNELYEMFNKGEADALADGYTENAMLYINGNNPIVGRQGKWVI